MEDILNARVKFVLQLKAFSVERRKGVFMCILKQTGIETQNHLSLQHSPIRTSETKADQPIMLRESKRLSQ